jgi:hypothetical protein
MTAPTKAGASRFGTFNQTTRAMGDAARPTDGSPLRINQRHRMGPGHVSVGYPLDSGRATARRQRPQ